MAERVAKYDNAKFVLITLVVIGHFIESFIFGFAPGERFAAGAFTFIYSFHMPLFILISGMFLREMNARSSFPIYRVMTLVILGFAMKIVRSIASWIATGTTTIQLFEDSSTPWFMFALAAWYAIAWLFRTHNRLSVLVLVLLVGTFAGYDAMIGDFLYLSRIIVFFPFFWIGYMLTPQRFAEVASRRWVRVGAALIMVVAAGACVFFTFDVLPLRFLFSGRLPFDETGIVGAAWYHRLLAYTIQVLMSFAVLVLIPRRNMGIVTTLGARSLQIYFWHFVPIMILRALGLFPWLASILPGVIWQIMLVLIAAAVSVALGWKPLGAPLTWITLPRSRTARNFR